jgi:hypothetical protein
MIAAIGRRIGRPADIIRRSFGGASSPAFDMAAQGDLRFWSDPSQATGVDGNPINPIPDFSGNGLNATQANASKQSTYILDGIGGRPSFYQDGTDDEALVPPSLLAGITPSSGFTYFGVFQRFGTAGYMALINSQNRVILTCIYNAGYLSVLQTQGGAPALDLDDNPHVICLAAKAGTGNADLYVDGVFAASFDAGSSTLNESLTLGGIGGGGVGRYEGYRGEEALFYGKLPAPNISATHSYLIPKWSI